MKTIHDSVVVMWEKYLSTPDTDNNLNKKYSTWNFCNDKDSANHLAELVKDGRKTATSSLYCLYEIEGEPVPEVDEYSIITDWDGVAQCIIRTKEINIIPFSDVKESFAKLEGEGDLSLNYWKKVHQKFFGEELKTMKLEFSQDMQVICEIFEMVYPKG